MQHQKIEQNNTYRVEISRMTSELYPYLQTEKKKFSQKDSIVINQKEYQKEKESQIYRVTYLPVESSTNEGAVTAFYKTKNAYQMEVTPVTEKGIIIGYLRFDYQKKINMVPFFIYASAALSLLYVCSLLLLFYVRQKILKPFVCFSEIPYELSQGNLTVHAKESKNRYFGKFLWGIEMLRDTLENQKQKELRLEKDKKMLLLSISHDIKTPLNAITLYAKAFEENMYTNREEEKMVAIKMQEKVKEINAFVAEIMRSSTEDILNIEVKQEEYYLMALLKKVNEAYIEKSRVKKIAFSIEEVDNQLLNGDIDRMYEAIGNVIENAYKYGDGKEIKIFFTKEEHFLLIHIYNSGVPVEEKEVLHLFESFYRGSNVKENQGNGLGLYICSEIMKKMFGDIYALTKIHGMEFVLVTPLS